MEKKKAKVATPAPKNSKEDQVRSRGCLYVSDIHQHLLRKELQGYKDIVRKAIATGKLSAEQKRTMREVCLSPGACID